MKQPPIPLLYYPSTVAEFDANIRTLKLKHFSPQELRHRMERPNNGMPDKSLWKNIVATVKALDDLREHLGQPITLNSVYRSPAYNKSVGGATFSNHMWFCAIDWTLTDPKRITVAFCEEVDKFLEARIKGGINKRAGRGFYPGRFIHIDVDHEQTPGARPLGQLTTWKG